MMHREVAAIVLCVLAQAASAQCVATPATADAAAGVATTVANAAHPAQPPARAELIKTAAAGTRDDMPPVMRESTRPIGVPQQERPRRGGTAMLLAAVALMSGIALRRYASNNP